ncbi:hypothetical protein C8R46DRAFT_846783, partial [Mycena filopes]
YLGLVKRLLQVPETVSLAINSDSDTIPTALSEYVDLCLTSLDQTWTSRTVRFLVVPHLCAPVILGMPW